MRTKGGARGAFAAPPATGSAPATPTGAVKAAVPPYPPTFCRPAIRKIAASSTRASISGTGPMAGAPTRVSRKEPPQLAESSSRRRRLAAGMGWFNGSPVFSDEWNCIGWWDHLCR